MSSRIACASRNGGARVLAVILALAVGDAAYAAVPYLTPEFGLDSPVRSAGWNAYWPAAAFDGTNTLVVWTDSRDLIDHVFGARVGPAGAVLDPMGITIGTTMN